MKLVTYLSADEEAQQTLVDANIQIPNRIDTAQEWASAPDAQPARSAWMRSAMSWAMVPLGMTTAAGLPTSVLGLGRSAAHVEVTPTAKKATAAATRCS